MAEKKFVNLDQLYFDPENPRLPKALYGSRDELKVIDYMVRFGNILELMDSIAQIGYSEAEPLLVVPVVGKEGKFIVVEGNRRLTALKILSKPESARVRKNSIDEVISNANYIPTSIPVIIYDNRNKILDYLGYRHITGVKDWGALEKARYLDQLYNLHINEASDSIYSVLAKMIGSRTDYVSRLHTALKLYELANNDAYYGIDIEESEIKFSWLTTALSYSNLVRYIGLTSAGDSTLKNLNKEHYSKLFTWLFHPDKKKLDESRQISVLNKVIESGEALKKLEEGATLTEALIYTSHPNETFELQMIKAKESLQRSKDIIEQLNAYPEHTINIINEIEKLCKSIKGAINENFLSDNKAKLENISPEKLNMILSILDKQGE
ncbi:ParB N-terminal domain-containing protein [Bacillus infantis]|uniref:ParB N-terminal domain-containing protein n=1 Tax=Bacillus infantis TaxID=324767 RepID=UPI0039827CC0